MAAESGQAYKVLKRMGAHSGENSEDGSFELPKYVSLGLSAAQCADRLAQATKLAKEFGPELARPAAQIFRTITKTGQWPRGGELKKDYL